MDRRAHLLELQRKWKPPGELARSRPREVRLTGAGKGLLALAVVLFAGAIVAAAALAAARAAEVGEQRALRETGAPAWSQITRVWRARDDEKTPWLSYRFEVGGRSYERSVKAPLAVWRTLRSGSSLPVHYLPADPRVSHPVAWQPRTMPSAIPFVAGAALAGLG